MKISAFDRVDAYKDVGMQVEQEQLRMYPQPKRAAML